jgi:MFS family permease
LHRHSCSTRTCSHIHARGIVNTFGAYQAFYETHYLASTPPSSISWIGTIQGFLLIVFGVITGPLYDLGYLRSLICVGTALVVFGLMMTSIATEYYQIFLAFGVCVGLGAGCLFVPSVAIVATYFSTKRAAATGLTAAGGSVGQYTMHTSVLVSIEANQKLAGGVIFPIVFRHLEVRLGFGWATRVIAFIALGTLAISVVLMKPRIHPAKKRSLLEPAAFKEPAYALFSISLFFVFIGLYIPFFYVPTYAQRELKTSDDLSFYLLAILNAASVFGRIIPNIIADYLGALNVLLPFTFCASILAFAWMAIHNVAGIVVFAILYGFFSGSVVSLPPTALAALSPDLSRVGTRMGMCFSFAGFGLLLGSPIAGAILKTKGGFAGAEAFGAAAVMIGFLFMALAVLAHRAGKNNKKSVL